MILTSPLFIIIILLIAFLVRRGIFSDVRVSTLLKWFAGIYAAALLLSVVVLYLLPQSGFAPGTDNREPDIYFAAKNGLLDQTEGIFAKGKWSFDYSSDTLEIAQQPGVMLWAQRKDSDEAKIDAVCYVAKSTADGVDYTHRIKIPDVNIAGKKLIVTNPGAYQINLARFERELTVSQFSDEELSQQWFSGPEMILLLRIPRNLELVGDSKGIQFVGE